MSFHSFLPFYITHERCNDQQSQPKNNREEEHQGRASQAGGKGEDAAGRRRGAAGVASTCRAAPGKPSRCGAHARRRSAAAEGAGRDSQVPDRRPPPPRLPRLRKVWMLSLPPGSLSASGSGVAAAAAAAVAGELGRGLHCRPRGAGSARRRLLRPGRQPHVAGLEGRRRRGSQGFLREHWLSGLPRICS